MVIEDDQFDNSFFADESEQGIDAWSPDGDLTFSGAEPAPGPVNHTIPGRDRARNAPPYYSYPSAMSSARTGSAFPTNANNNTAVPLGFQPYYDSAYTPVAANDGWTTTSASGTGSINSTDTSSGFPFDGNSFVSLQQQYAQIEHRPSYMTAVPQSFAQTERTVPAKELWGGDLGLDPGADAAGMANLNYSPVSQPGSFFEGSLGSPDISGGSESNFNFNGTAGIANYASTSISSAPESPISARAQQHDNKRAKKSAKDGSNPSTSASSSGRGGAGAKGKQKRELRSASRTSKNKQERVAETTEEQKSRNSHNLVEKQYRNRLNAQFEDLLHTLPESSWSGGGGATLEGGRGDGGGGSGRAATAAAANKGEKKRVSKAEVLEIARQRILFLEEENGRIERENDELRRRSVG